MNIKVYGMEGCGLCEAAKTKLRMMKLDYESWDIEDLVDGIVWDEVGLAAYAFNDNHLPVLVVDGIGLNYPAAMKYLKRRT